MAGRLQDKVCLITGSDGIAAATARVASNEGARVFIAGKDWETVEPLACELSAAAEVADLTRAGAAERVVEACCAAYGRLDALFNVAGASGRSFGDGPVHECTDEGWSMTLEVNLGTAFRMCRAALRVMLRQEPGAGGVRGAVLNMASVLAFSPERRFFATHAYAAAKAGIIGLTRSMAAYYASHGIRVNAIAPALVRTRMSLRAQSDERLLAFLAEKQPLSGGMLEPLDIAHTAVFLMSDEARVTTGLVYTADGGWTTA